MEEHFFFLRWIFALFALLDIFRIRKVSLIFYFFGTLLLKITNYIYI